MNKIKRSGKIGLIVYVHLFWKCRRTEMMQYKYRKKEKRKEK